jgi:hypothetical protein|tara:strand:- start:492 stop:1109 length:618 start_codon:yes stop_codon:yes gene_type:complete
MTEEEIKKVVDDFEKYYRRKYPTFEITGGGPTAKHQPAEFALTTEEEQILHFYKGGVGKLASNKSFEIYSGHDADVNNGEVTGEGAIAIKLECKNGRIHIEAKSSDIEINGRNISLVAKENIYLNAGKNIKTNSGADTEMIAGADFTADATKEIFINGGGAVGIHCESEHIHTSSGLDEDSAPDFYQEITPFHDAKIESYNANDS